MNMVKLLSCQVRITFLNYLDVLNEFLQEGGATEGDKLQSGRCKIMSLIYHLSFHEGRFKNCRILINPI